MRVPLRPIVLTLAVVLAGHQLVYLASYGLRGADQALSSVGHGGYWLGTGALVSLALTAGLLLGLRRWMALRAELRAADPDPRRAGSIDWAAFRTTVARLVPRLALSALLLFVIQENLEHYAYHAGHAPGLGVLVGPEYVATIPIFALVAAMVAAISSLLRLGLASLARLADRLRRRRPEHVTIRPGRQLVRVHRWSHFTPDLGRAPPLAA